MQSGSSERMAAILSRRQKNSFKVSGIRMYRLLKDSFISAIDDIWDHARHENGKW